jgi:DNA-binding transcriptional regulator PaaX
MLERRGGASLVDLVEHTGWQPHTTRAALTGLRKKGHIIAKESREGITVYRIVKAAS